MFLWLITPIDVKIGQKCKLKEDFKFTYPKNKQLITIPSDTFLEIVDVRWPQETGDITEDVIEFFKDKFDFNKEREEDPIITVSYTFEDFTILISLEPEDVYLCY